MLKQLLKPAVLTAFVTFLSAPAIAQIHVEVPMPGIQIQFGHSAPPPMRYERRPPRPSSQHVWIGGAWGWQGNDWVWGPGRWDRPQSHGVRWVATRNYRDGDGWRHEPGHWSNQRLVRVEEDRRERGEGDRRHDNGHDHDKN